MTTQTRLKSFRLSVLAVFCVFAISLIGASAAQKQGIKRDDARKLIAAASILELNKDVVTVREISPPGATVTVLASVKLAFRFVRDEAGAWRVVEVRTGDRQWETFDLLARALGGEQVANARAELDAFAAELSALTAAASKKDKAASTEEQQNQKAQNENQTAKGDSSQPAKELRRGALSVRNPASALAPLGSSAVVEIEVETSVDFARDARGRWQVARVSFGSGGGRGFDQFDAFERALNAEKLARARADLETLAAALEEYRRARGFYVVADSASALIDHLNPRHTLAYIRFDPWHRPYEYQGTRERFTLRSPGADGKSNTADDITVGK